MAIKKIYMRDANGLTKECTEAYIGINGLSTEMFSPEPVFDGIIYDNGNEKCYLTSYGTDFASGYSEFTNKQSMQLLKESNYLRIQETLSRNSTTMGGTDQKIDFSQYNTLHVDFQINYSSGVNGLFSISPDKNANTNSIPYGSNGNSPWGGSHLTDAQYDISSISGENYFSFSTYSANGGSINMFIYKIWLD